jgi:hypothetical protein
LPCGKTLRKMVERPLNYIMNGGLRKSRLIADPHNQVAFRQISHEAALAMNSIF